MGEPQTQFALATAAPQDPDFTDLQQSRVIEFGQKKQKIQLETFSFLGQKLRSGVNTILGKKLRAAQANVYALCLQEKNSNKVNESEFGEWCWKGQAPFKSDSVTNDPAGVLGGMGFQGGGLHSSGSAIDINLDFNPFVPTRCAGGQTFGGELQLRAFDPKFLEKKAGLTPDEVTEYAAARKGGKMSDALEKKITPFVTEFLRDGIWKKAALVYDTAHMLFYNTLADVSQDPRGAATMRTSGTPKAQAEAEYKRFKEVSDSLRAYFNFFFQGPDKPVTLDAFKTNFMQKIGEGNLNKTLTANINNMSDQERNEFLERVYQQGLRHYETMKLAVVNGRVSVDENGNITAPRHRDPRVGFLNIRQEVVVELLFGQGLRWGACMFGCGPDGSGDMMHFDLHGHVFDAL